MKQYFLRMSAVELASFVLDEFSNMSSDEQESLLKNRDFIYALFSSSIGMNMGGNAFYNLSLLYKKNPKLLYETFSKENIEILKTIKRTILLENICYHSFDTIISDYMLVNEDFKFLYDDFRFVSYLLEKGDSSAKIHYEFFSNNLDIIQLSNVYKYFKLDKIESEELDLLVAIKERIGNPTKFYSMLNKDSVVKLLNQGFFHLFSDDDIQQLVEDFYFYKYTNLPNYVLQNKDFLKAFINKANNCTYLPQLIKILDILQMNNAESYLVYKEIINKIIDKRKFKTMEELSIRFFYDECENVLMNIKVILKYCESNPEYRNLIPDDIYEIYSKIMSTHRYIDNNIYNEMIKSNKAYDKLLYEHLDLARNMFHSDLSSSLTPLNCVSKVIKDVKVHVYKGEDFSFIIHATVGKSGDADVYADELKYRLNSKNITTRYYVSTSYINQNNISVFRKSGIIYGFNDLKDMIMVHAACQDSFVRNRGTKETVITHAPTYLNLDEFSNQSSYSEIIFKPTKLQPDFIVCYDTIDKYDIAVAKKLGIDIVLINSKKYEKKYDDRNDIEVTNNRYI